MILRKSDEAMALSASVVATAMRRISCTLNFTVSSKFHAFAYRRGQFVICEQSSTIL